MPSAGKVLPRSSASVVLSDSGYGSLHQAASSHSDRVIAQLFPSAGKVLPGSSASAIFSDSGYGSLHQSASLHSDRVIAQLLPSAGKVLPSSLASVVSSDSGYGPSEPSSAPQKTPKQRGTGRQVHGVALLKEDNHVDTVDQVLYSLSMADPSLVGQNQSDLFQVLLEIFKDDLILKPLFAMAEERMDHNNAVTNLEEFISGYCILLQAEGPDSSQSGAIQFLRHRARDFAERVHDPASTHLYGYQSDQGDDAYGPQADADIASVTGVLEGLSDSNEPELPKNLGNIIAFLTEGVAMEQFRLHYQRFVEGKPLDDWNARVRTPTEMTTKAQTPESTLPLDISLKERAKVSYEEEKISPIDLFVQDPESYNEIVDILQRQVFEYGSRVLGEIEQRDGFQLLLLPTAPVPDPGENSESTHDELRFLLERDLAMTSAILKGISFLTEEQFCNSIYNLIVADPKRDHVLRVIPMTVPNLELLRDLLHEAVSYCTASSHDSLLMETISDIGATTGQILDYLGLSALSVEIRAANSHQDCILLCRSLSSMCSILFLGLVSYVKSHLGDGDCALPGFGELRIETVHKSRTVSMAAQRLACLDSFVRHPLWTFSITPETPHPQSAKIDRYYLSVLLADFTDLWGPIRLAYIDQTRNLVAEIQVRGGVIRRSEPPYTSPDAQDDEVSCHFYGWMHKSFNNKVDAMSSISTTDRLLIGALKNTKALTEDNPFRILYECSCARGTHYSYRYPSFELSTKAPTYKLDAKTGQVSAAHYLGVSLGAVWKLGPGITLKDAIVEDWYNASQAASNVMPHDPKACYLDYLAVLEISQCTGHARRTNLWSILRSRALRRSIDVLLGREHGNHLHMILIREQETDQTVMMPSKQPRSFVDIWKILSDVEKLLIKQVMVTILRNLRSTGVDEDGNLQAWDVTSSDRIDGRKIVPSWRSMVKDNTESAAFAIITERCMQYKASALLTSPSEPPRILLTKVCISTNPELKINRPRIDSRHHPMFTQYCVGTPRSSMGTLDLQSLRGMKQIQKPLPPALSAQIGERQYERRRRMDSNMAVAKMGLVTLSPPQASASSVKTVEKQATRSMSSNVSSSSFGSSSDCQTGASSLTVDNAREDLLCNVSLRFKNGSGTLRLEPPKHMMPDVETEGVPRFKLSTSSEADFIPAKWKARRNSVLNSIQEKGEELQERASKFIVARTKRLPWMIDQYEPVKESRVDVIEHIRGGDLMDNQMVLTVHVR
ncbi:MAG: hypothetical protein FRX48_03623 [Lasallia pustulata]|uniref:Uncharacterized protein n=1 Tax=Lasallia pustulata TaxID=136370 RepID=A0A5M8PVD8_9LECA|nr:MAG: hypothetical protein FRX48_03623 [Lasallia pustulata]